MKNRLSDKAIEIANDLHKEKLDYQSEYIPLINALNKLAKYEDAEEAGQLIRLPCKVGDTLYTNQMVQGWYLREANRPFPVDICFIGINGEDNFFNVDYKCGHMLEFKFSDIGKTIFRTKEEAEQVLKEALNEG